MAKDDGTQALTDAQHARFARGFLDRYLTPAFGSLTKSELDLLVFSLLHEVGYLRPTDSQYDIARRLRVAPTRVRSLTMQMELRDTSQTEASLVTRIVDCLSTARFVKERRPPMPLFWRATVERTRFRASRKVSYRVHGLIDPSPP